MILIPIDVGSPGLAILFERYAFSSLGLAIRVSKPLRVRAIGRL